jgi:hypothetical protein
MKLLVTACWVILAVCVIAAQNQPSSLIINTGGRNTTSLDGKWQTIIDPYETGFYDYRYKERTDGYFKNTKPKGNDLIEYDFDLSPQLNVPGDWNSQVVQKVVRLSEKVGNTRVRLFRRGKLPGRCLSERAKAGASHRRFHPVQF